MFKYKSETNASRFYRQGEAFYNKGNYSDAYYNYKQINRFSELYSVSLLKQYMCANKLEDKKTAHAKLVDLIRSSKNASIRPYALYYEAVLALELGINNPQQSLKKFKKILEQYPNNDFYYASAYKAGTLSDDRIFSKDNYIEYLKYAPTGKFALSALDNIKAFQDILTPDDNKIIANSYYQNSKYAEALEYYRKTDFSNNWFEISKCFRQLNKYEEEKATIINGLNIGQSEMEEKDVDLALNRLASILAMNKIQLLQDLYRKNSDSYIYPTVIYNLAESTQSINSVKLYEQIVKNYPNSSWASNSLWEIFWYNYSLERYNTCIKLGKMHQNKYSKSADAPRVLYWSAKALLNEKRNQEARELFYKVIKDYPLTYYAFLSARQLKFSKAGKIIVKKPIGHFDYNSLNKFIFKDDKMLLFLAKNNDIEALEELKINDEYIKAWLMFKKKNYPNSINTAKKEYLKRISENDEIHPSYSDKELKFIYPVLYEDEINEYAQKYRQSPYLFLSIVREESHFNKDAKSSAGALGLVQLMPATASFIEQKALTSQTLKENNIKIGLKYFNYLYEQFNRNEYLAILAYNAGPGNVKKWLSDPFIKSGEIDELVENVPYLETKNYIKKVLSAYWIYFNIYK